MIASLRRELGMTQEELGKAANVSTQAVSRWERGGSPDIALLPTIADILGVSIDTLFSHDSFGKMQIEDQIHRCILRIPPEQRFEYAYHLAWYIIKVTATSLDPKGDAYYWYMTDGENVDRKNARQPESVPSVNYISHNQGLMQASVAKDFHYALLMPQPEDGFVSITKYADEYRRFFSFLASPHAMEVLAFIYTLKPGQHFTASLAARQLKLSSEETENILRQMYELRLVQDTCAQTADGDLHVYHCMEDTAIIPFLYMATEVMRTQDIVGTYNMRETPWFDAPLGTRCLSPLWRTRDRMEKELDFPSSLSGNHSPD